MKVFVLVGEYSNYDEHGSWIVRAFVNLAAAEDAQNDLIRRTAVAAKMFDEMRKKAQDESEKARHLHEADPANVAYKLRLNQMKLPPETPRYEKRARLRDLHSMVPVPQSVQDFNKWVADHASAFETQTAELLASIHPFYPSASLYNLSGTIYIIEETELVEA